VTPEKILKKSCESGKHPVSSALWPNQRCTQSDGSVIVHAGRSWMQFDADDLQQLYTYAADRPTIQRYGVAAPESPQTGE